MLSNKIKGEKKGKTSKACRLRKRKKQIHKSKEKGRTQNGTKASFSEVKAKRPAPNSEPSDDAKTDPGENPKSLRKEKEEEIF